MTGERRRWPFSRRPSGAGEGEVGSRPPASVLNGRYRLEKLLGCGTAAAVHQALDLHTGQRVAVKLAAIPDNLTLTARVEWLARMQRETAIARRLRHPDILQVRDAGMDEQRAWLVTELVHGHDLSRYTHRNRLLPDSLVLRYGARLADALAYAHSQGVLHRDVKPQNVLLDLSTDTLKLADFGVAHAHDAVITRTGVMLGTPVYMAPEQLAGAPATAASDAYALGLLLYELLSGQRPYPADTLAALLSLLRERARPTLDQLRPDLSPVAVAQVEALLNPEPAQRPSDLLAWARRSDMLARALRVDTAVAPLAVLTNA